MSITTTVEKDTIKLPDGIHVPDGTRVRLEIATAGASQWPSDYFERTAGALAGEPLERPAQGGKDIDLCGEAARDGFGILDRMEAQDVPVD